MNVNKSMAYIRGLAVGRGLVRTGLFRSEGFLRLLLGGGGSLLSKCYGRRLLLITFFLIYFWLCNTDFQERNKRSLETNRIKRSRDERSTSHKHLEVAMVADDLVVKRHGEVNLTEYLLMLAHVVKPRILP